MPNYVITESVGNRVEQVNSYQDLEKHHPSSGREAGRQYQTIDGELEEVRTANRDTAHVKKDFIIDPPTIPAPAAGTIRALNDEWNTVQIVDDNGKVLAQALHMERGSQPANGSRIEYGQTLGRMGDTGSPGSIHAHVEAPPAVFERYINDITSGRIQSNGAAVSSPNLDPMSDGVLKHGERGDSIKTLQEALNNAGIRDAQGQPLPTTGYYGDMTEAAVRKYQEQKGLEVDGKAGNDTLTALGLKPDQQQTPPQQTPVEQKPGETAPVQQPTGNQVPGGPNDFGSTNPLGTLISSGEGGYGSYNRGRAGDANGAQIDFSQMTVGEVMRRQDLPRDDPDRLFAVGKYQMIPGTFEEGVNALGIDRNAKFTPQLQERMFADYLVDEKRPQVKDYITGETNGAAGLQGAQLALAREFASVADPRTGRSVYDGDSAGNSASITAAQVGTALDQMRGQYQANIKSGMSADEAYRALSGDPTQVQGGQTQGGQTPRGQSGSTSDTLLVKEERGDGVKGLQEALNNAGVRDAQGQPLPTTGYFGDQTEAAVRKYQEQKGLEVDGKAGKDTLTALGIYPGQQQTAPTDKPQTPAETTAEKPQVPAANVTDNPQTPAANSDKPQVPASNDTLQPPTQNDKPLISNPNHPDNKLYQQALSNLEQLGPGGGFKSREDMEKAAASVAADAKATGLQSIDHISKTSAPNGQNYLVAVQGDPTSAASKNSYIDYNQAVSQGVDQSTKMAEATKPAVQQAQQVDQTQQQEQNKVAVGAR
ncbi:MAG: peptidoglycan-binding protein [Xanthomonadales bacterium]|nr:peptidoglycan-binding protein [Xanthomonadales bacterium]